MKNKNNRKRGAAIELAILALALVAIFGTAVMSIMLSEAKYIKTDKAELTVAYERLKCEKTAKDSIRRILKKGITPTSTNVNTGGLANVEPTISDDMNSCTITNWEWLDKDEKQD